MAAEGRKGGPPVGEAVVAIRVARSDEYAAAGDLVADVYAREGFAHGAYVGVLRDAARRAAEADLLVAVEDGGRVVGTLTYAPGGTPWADVAAPDEAEFRMLAVLPEARGRGVAERLVRAAIDRVWSDGKRRLALSSQPSMRSAHRLYQRLGFARAPERDWSPGPGTGLLRVYTMDVGSS